MVFPHETSMSIDLRAALHSDRHWSRSDVLQDGRVKAAEGAVQQEGSAKVWCWEGWVGARG